MFDVINQVVRITGSVAMAGAPEGGGGNLVSMLVLMGILVAIWYFLIIGPERKRKARLQEMINNLKSGDRIITVGGIHGTVSGVTDKTVILRVADQVKIEISRQAVGTVVKPEGEEDIEENK